MEIFSEQNESTRIPWDGLIRTTYECGGAIPERIRKYREALIPLENALNLEELVVEYKNLKFTKEDRNYLNSTVLDLIGKMLNKSIFSLAEPWTSMVNNDQFLFFWKFRDEKIMGKGYAYPFLIQCLKHSRKMFEELYPISSERWEFNYCFDNDINHILYYFASDYVPPGMNRQALIEGVPHQPDIDMIRYLCEREFFVTDETYAFLCKRPGIPLEIWQVFLSYFPPDTDTFCHLLENALSQYFRFFLKYGAGMDSLSETVRDFFVKTEEEDKMKVYAQERIPVQLEDIIHYNILQTDPMVVVDKNKKKYEVRLVEIKEESVAMNVDE